MKKFKRIKITPLTPAEGIKVKVAKKIRFDLSSIPDAHRDALLKIAQRFTKKNNGAFITGGLKGEKPYLATQLKSAQLKEDIFTFPEPNPVRLYYSNAVKHLKEANTAKAAFYAASSRANPTLQSEAYIVFLSEVSIGIVSLIMTIEGFINQLLSEDKTYEIDGKKIGKNEIEWFDLNKKIREVIPILSGINYVVEHQVDYERISLINSKRDALIHLKTTEAGNFTSYQILFKQLLDIDLIECANSVFHFVTTIKPTYFVEET